MLAEKTNRKLHNKYKNFNHIYYSSINKSQFMHSWITDNIGLMQYLIKNYKWMMCDFIEKSSMQVWTTQKNVPTVKQQPGDLSTIYRSYAESESCIHRHIIHASLNHIDITVTEKWTWSKSYNLWACLWSCRRTKVFF